MAFPSIRSQATDSITAIETSHTVSLPATVVAGDTILVAIRVTVAGAIGWPSADWNVLFDESPDGSDDQQSAAWKRADGTEGGTTITVTSGNGKFISIAIAVQDAADPHRRPPFLGTAGTGVSPTEPNAGICDPAAGARDYLWWTAYSMEGEQTGITAYPANYTLNQSGIVTTGTSGAVTTNCTGASAARQLNAASEDVGAWDVTGTIDDWTARTIAFFPVEPVPITVAPAFISPKSSLGLVGLTIAVNLLQSTLAPAQEVINYAEQVVFLRNKPSIGSNELSITNNNLQNTLKPADPPFYEIKWPNPLIGGKNLVGFTYSPQLLEPFIPVSYPNPLIGIKKNPDWSQSRSIVLEDEYPVGSIHTVNPIIGRRGEGFVFNKQIDVLVDAPFNPVTFDNPGLPKQQNKGVAHERPQYYEDSIQTNQYNWPNPSPSLLKHRTWTSNLLESTLAPITGDPFSQKNWLNPSPVKDQITIDIVSRPEAPVVGSPLPKVDWKNPLPRKLADNRTWIVNLQQSTLLKDPPPTYLLSTNPILRREEPVKDWIYVQQKDINVGIPFNPVNYPNPQVKKVPVRDWNKDKPSYYVNPVQSSCIITLGIGAPGDITCFTLVGLDPNPQPTTFPAGVAVYDILPTLRRKSAGLTWIQTRKEYYVDIYPNNKQSTVIPNVAKRQTNTWTQNKPTYLTDNLTKPTNQNNWPNPLKNAFELVTSISSRPSNLPSTTKPFNQNDWPIVRGKKKNQDWNDYVVFDQNNPSPAQFTSIAIPRRRVLSPSWIQPALISGSIFGQLPGKQVYDNPKLKTKITGGWIRQSISVQAVPSFFTSEFNNPVVRIVRASSWTQDKPFYYEEVAPETSLAYPNPQLKVYRLIDWINYTQIQDEQIVQPYDISIQFQKRRTAEAWIVNLLQSTLEPAAEEVPFNQKDYPNPLLYERSSGWIWDRPFYYIDVLPFSQINYPNPRLRLSNRLSIELPRPSYYIEPVDPFRQVEWHNPTLTKKANSDWYYNQILGSLNIPVVGQSSQPNPVLRVKDRSLLTWIENRAGYITDELISRVFDYPVPRKRLSVDYAWIGSPLTVIGIVEGETPFHQNEWLVFRGIKSRADLFGVINSLTTTLPAIRGRIICLEADATEYDLMAIIEEYDLDVRLTIFDLEAGGTECE